MEKGTEGLEKILEFVAKAAIIGKKVWEDKEVNFKDIEHAPELFDLVKDIYAFIQSKPELGAEVKDISVVEILNLIAKGDSLVKEVEKA